MTKCTSSSVIFQGFKRKKFQLDFSGGDISSNGGLLLMSQLDKKIGITKRAGKILSDHESRQAGKIQHSSLSMFRQRVFSLIAGHEDLNDQFELSKDPLLQSVVGQDTPLAQPSTLCRFENHATHQFCVDLSKLMVELFIESFSTPPKELILDFDATDDLTYGMQEKRRTCKK